MRLKMKENNIFKITPKKMFKTHYLIFIQVNITRTNDSIEYKQKWEDDHTDVTFSTSNARHFFISLYEKISIIFN